jgi:hypothetical protein
MKGATFTVTKYDTFAGTNDDTLTVTKDDTFAMMKNDIFNVTTATMDNDRSHDRVDDTPFHYPA